MQLKYIASLAEYQRITLLLFTLFDVKDGDGAKVKKLMKTVADISSYDLKITIHELSAKDMLVSGGYNWRTYQYDYVVADECLLRFMLYYYTEEKELVERVMAAATGFKPQPVQRMLWKFIISNFTQTGPRSIVAELLDGRHKLLAPCLMDERFEPLVLSLRFDTLLTLVNNYSWEIFTYEQLLSTSNLRRLIGAFDATPEQRRLLMRTECFLDLYDYLAHGVRPERLMADDGYHQALAAFVEMYGGHYDKAVNHMRMAATLCFQHTQQGGHKNFFSWDVLNFFYVLMVRLANTEEAYKRISFLIRSRKQEVALDAALLHDIVYLQASNQEVKLLLFSYYRDLYKGNKSLQKVMLAYMGWLPGDLSMPRWLIFKQEMRRWRKLDAADAEKADEAYGQQGALERIARKQEWETVLEALMGKTVPEEQGAAPKERIAYFIDRRHPNDAVPKLQVVLKNGNWSAGRNVSQGDFIQGSAIAMNDADRRIAMAMRQGMFYYGEIPLKHVLPEMTEESRLYVGNYAPYTLVEVTEEAPYMTLKREDGRFKILSNVKLDDIDEDLIITHRGTASINFLRLDSNQRFYYKRLLQLGEFPLEAESQLRDFLANIGGKLEVNSDLIEGGSTLPTVAGQPLLIMQLRPQGKEAYAMSVFVRPLEGGRIRCMPGEGDDFIVDQNAEGRQRVNRDLKREKENMDHFLSSCQLTEIRQGSYDIDTYSLLPLISYAQQNSDRIACEWPEGARLKVNQRKTSNLWAGAITKNDNGWFEIEGSVEIDQDHVVSMAQLLDLVDHSHGRFIKLGEHEFIELSESLQRQLNVLDSVAARTHGKLQMSPFSAALLGSDVLEGELQLEVADELKAIRQRIIDASTYKPRVPKTLKATLRPYQKEGFEWMSRLNKWGAGALLADDMGLGKTIQTITYLLAKANEGPALVVAPASVAPNWKSELQRFAPSLNAQMLNYAADRKKLIKEAKKGDVVITTYGLLLSVKTTITKKKWTTVCLDEAHIVKNRGAKTSAVAMQLQGDNRIMLTGTPVQNHLGELWNLFQFVNPGLLGAFEDFNRRFITPIEQQGDKTAQQQLDCLVKPFMLRRTKDRVAKELPEKQEIYQHVELSKEEQTIYELMRQRAEALLLAEQGSGVSVATLAEITRLRQCSCDARLIEEGRKVMARKQGAKIEALTELLTTIIDGFETDSKGKQQGGVLVFSQFTSYLALIQDALKKARIPYLYIDGSVDIKTRTRLVEEFQQGQCPVFLISLKAGGLGLNLTRANYVIHMDPWWNPAIEAQATDRAHRLGQKQAVTVYHLIAEGTIEEKIQRLHEQKQQLVRDVLEGSDMSHKLTGEELLAMVRS